QVGRAGAHDEVVPGDLGLDVGLLDVELGRSGRAAVVVEVGGEVGRPDAVELVVDRNVHTLDVEVDPVRALRRGRGERQAGVADVALHVDAAEVRENSAADLGISPPAGLRLRLGDLLLDFAGDRLDLARHLILGAPGPGFGVGEPVLHLRHL